MQEKANRLKQKATLGDAWLSLVHKRSYITTDGREHTSQRQFVESTAKRKVIRAGRRGGKTVGIARAAIEAFEAGKRVLYAAPTEDQVATFWWEIKQALNDAIEAKFLYKNETKHIIEVPNTKNRIRAKTAWDAETLRGDYADFLILDEFQLMSEETWETVGSPMLIDNDGDAVFIYTPPSINTAARSKAKDRRYAAKLFKAAQADTTGDWATFHFTSYDNPFNPIEGINRIAAGMTSAARLREIMAEDSDEVPGALWKVDWLDNTRRETHPELARIVIGVDPPGSVGTECGIVVGGLGIDGHGYVLEDTSLHGSPDDWGKAVVSAYQRWSVDRIVGEKNYGGDMVEHVIRTAPGGKHVSYKNVIATRGKAVRAEPVSALYEQNKIHHVGDFPQLENEQCNWVPNSGMLSPNRLDALVWVYTELMVGEVAFTEEEIKDWSDNKLNVNNISDDLKRALEASGIDLSKL